jgi:hypothetical protein
VYEKTTKYVGKKRMSCRLNQTPHIGNTMNLPTSLIDHPISQPNFDNTPIWNPVITEKLEPCPVWIDGKSVFFIQVSCGEFFLCSDEFHSDNSLVQGFIRMETLIF